MWESTLSFNEIIGAARSKERELIESGKFTRSGGEGLMVERMIRPAIR